MKGDQQIRNELQREIPKDAELDDYCLEAVKRNSSYTDVSDW